MFNGFLAESYLIYNLKENDYQKYLSDYQRAKCRFINGDYSIILNDKLVFENMLKPYIRTPETAAIILKGKFYSMNKDLDISNVENLLEYCSGVNKLILKPYRDSDGGRGIFVLSIKNKKIYLNQKEHSIIEFLELVKELNFYMVSEFIYQNDFSNSLYPHSVNTIRILTMTYPDTNEPFLATSVYRIGTDESAPVDNWSSGGISVQIDLSSGELSKGIIFKGTKELKYVNSHPNTNAQIKGEKIPNWYEVKRQVLRTAKQFPYLKYIAWDIILGDDDKIIILEGNNCSDVNLLQAHEPLLVNKDVYDFYKFHKIIR